jgi:hypothetical protein
MVNIGGALKRGRKVAESLMVDTCVVRRATGEPTTDPVTFEVTPDVTTVYTGRCKVQSHEAFEQERETVGATAQIARIRVDLPVGSGPFNPGDVVTITAAAHDPLLAGRHFRLTVPGPYKSLATAYRVAAEELTGAEVPSWT